MLSVLFERENFISEQDSSHQLMMITGDAPLTACHAAKQVHILDRPVLILVHRSAPKLALNHRALACTVHVLEILRLFMTVQPGSRYVGMSTCAKHGTSTLHSKTQPG